MELTTVEEYYRGNFPYYKRPYIVNFFSVDEKGHNFHSTKNLSYLDWGKFGFKRNVFDLTIGENISVRRTQENSYTFYRHLSEHHVNVHNFSSSELKNVGFICNRQVLRKIAHLPYEYRNDELFSAYLYEGNIYLGYIKDEEPFNPRFDRCSRWGYKFEQYLMSDKPGFDPKTNDPVNEAEEFACVFESKLNDHRLMFAAEMDGILIEKFEKCTPVPDVDNFIDSVIVENLRKRNFVELKTSYNTENDYKFRKFKSIEIWLQSFFSGVEIIVIGYRTTGGKVYSIKRYNTNDMIYIGNKDWDPAVCMNFCDRFLTFVKDCFLMKLSKMPNWKPDVDIRGYDPIELFFERKTSSNVIMSEKSNNVVMPYKFPWFIDTVSRKIKEQ